MKTVHYVSIILAIALGYALPHAFPETYLITTSSQEHMVAEDHGHNDLPGMMHSHDPIEVDGELPVPIVSIQVNEDAMAGYNLKIITENFVRAPEKASNTGPNPNEGHAHLYVNNTKVGRVYGPDYHIGDTYFMPGENEVKVTLNANQHSDWTLEGEVISDSVIISQ